MKMLIINGRTIPLNHEARRILEEAKEQEVDRSTLVFHKATGEALGNIRNAFESACKRAGILDFCFHDLRHSFASALAMRGVPLQAIAELLGHRTLAMTQRYAHLSPQVLMGAVEQASRYFDGYEPSGVERLPAVKGDQDSGTVENGTSVIPLPEVAGVGAREVVS